MIKFFRKIRQKMLTENKFSKYLIYAIGEIILVVLGILIALQINNWNENNKKRKSIEQSLIEIRDNLRTDNLETPKIIDRAENEIKIQEELIETLEKKVVLDSTHNYKIGKCNTLNGISITVTGYEKIKEIGLGNLKNKELETELIFYYEKLKKRFEQQQVYDRNSLTNMWFPYIQANFKDFSYRNYAIPNSYEALSRDSEFLVLLKINLDTRIPTLNSLMDLHNSSKKLIELIDSELKIKK
ncbi:DUF6090 family protein [Ichthyenterobacterium sp. W332]|uniref:DUF6090 family protein n=1 Tax=Microcosmobacter mediterraneus TaxID=3075607 RepID=A0ABU2YMA7_9FLAO|nr:DUF6090 family protein [Ichthyenterobacterium sp. W332]MDT0559293.1 DUF6090 family protein [Ichthyenterobacterium sp. W332]